VILNNKYVLKRFIIFTHASAFNLTLKKILGRDLENIGKKYIQKFIYLSIFLHSFRNFLCDDWNFM